MLFQIQDCEPTMAVINDDLIKLSNLILLCLASCLIEVFLRELRFSPLLKNQHLIWFDLIYLIYSLPN